MSFEFVEESFSDIIESTDYVANGSFATLKENVEYQEDKGFAVLVRLVDFNANWQGKKVYVSEKAYNFLRKSSLKAGDVIVSNVGANAGTVFRVPKLNQPATLGPNAILVRPRSNKLISDYLYYYLTSPIGQNELQSIITGGAQPKFNKTALRSLKIPLPSLKYQYETSLLMNALDDRITLLRETNATLEAIAQALFKSWFVDFDPVHAKQQGRLPEGMDEQTAALFPDSFEESELGLVPKGWEVKTLNEVCKISSGKRPPERSDIETLTTKTPLFGGAGLMGFTNESLFNEPKIITGRVGTLGKNFIAYPPFWASDNALILSPLKTQDFHFCFHWLNGIDVHGLNRGAVQPLLTQKDLGNQQRTVPPDELVVLFSDVTKSIYSKINHQTKQAQTLADLRDTLLPRLISGQLRVGI